MNFRRRYSIIYLASPYSHEDPNIMEYRFAAVCRAAGVLLSQGILVFSPIAHSHPIAARGTADGLWETWEAFDLHMLEKATQMWILALPGWNESKGVREEAQFASSLGLPVRLVTPEGVIVVLDAEGAMTPDPEYDALDAALIEEVDLADFE